MSEVARDRYGTLAAATAANFGQFGTRVAISPLVLAIAATFGVTKGEIGTVLTLLWAAFALLQFPSGVFADRFGERRVMVVALALTTLVAALGTYVFQSFVSFFPAFLQEYHGFSQGTASLAFGATFALCGPFLIAAAGFAALLLSPARPVTYAGVVVAGADQKE